jgi:hypothetical protein
MNTTELDPVSRLLRYPTAIVSDALDELGVDGVLTGMRAQRVGQARTAGRALPVQSRGTPCSCGGMKFRRSRAA